MASATVSGDLVVVDGTVTNKGTAASKPSTVVATARWGESGRDEIDPLAAQGGSQPFQIKLLIPDGLEPETYTIVVQVDPGGTNEEAEEENNDDSVEVRIGADARPRRRPDLAITGLEYRIDGDDLVFDLRVANSGKVGAPSTRVEARARDWEFAHAVPALLAEVTDVPVTVRARIPEERRNASYDFTLEINPAPGVPEVSRDDNSRTIEVDVPGRPDLAVEKAGEPFEKDGQLLLPVVVENIGDEPASASRVVATAGRWRSASEGVPALDPGDEESVDLELDVTDRARGRSYTFAVTVPAVDGEEATRNNRTAVDVTLPRVPLPPPDEGGFPLVAVAVTAGAVLLVALVAWQALRRGRVGGGVAGSFELPRGREPEPDTEVLEAPAPRVVNTGFANDAQPDVPLAPNRGLACATDYLFWLDVGPPAPGSIEAQPTALPDLPADARLTVALFGLDGGFELPDGLTVGELRLAGGKVVVTRQPTAGAARQPRSRLLDARLFFPARTPAEERVAQMRCSIYHEGTLVQSRLVRAVTTSVPTRKEGALEWVLDYTIAPSLDPTRLARLPRHDLSVMVNRNADGTHGFSFAGADGEHTGEASFSELELQNLVTKTRAGLRKVAWGDEELWAKTKPYRYDPLDRKLLRDDLVLLAVRGYRAYDAIVDKLAGNLGADELETILRAPAYVQIASKERPSHLLPSALLYDHPAFDTAARDHTICEAFLAATDETVAPTEGAESALLDLPCFQGNCPNRMSRTVVCPSGFWGYRHALGVPVSVADGFDAPPVIARGPRPALTVAVSTDPELELRKDHERELRALFEGFEWNYADTRNVTLEYLQEKKAQLVYFYCHGGIEGGVPYLQVGGPTERGITADQIRSYRIRWDEPRPLVVINGCRTAELEPERAIEFVGPLVSRAQAAGVIGTEITIFEPLARWFAMECFRRFLEGLPIGEAVRRARLALLERGNPLGLVYIPFVLAGLRLERDGTR